MSHPFGDLLTQHLHRKHGLSQSKLAAGILQSPSIITDMSQGKRLNGPQARERVTAIIAWLQQQGALETLTEANALLNAAGMAPLQERAVNEAILVRKLSIQAQQQPHPRPAGTRSLLREGTVAAPPRHNLPSQLTPFIGRTEQIMQLVQQCQTRRLLTLTGAGGVGKTRLALQMATQMRERFTDGVWFVDLAPLTDPESALQRILDLFHLPEQPDRSRLVMVTAYLSSKQLLLILDNCEHLIDGCAELAEAILQHCPQVSLLATSREALNIGGELPWRVPSLTRPLANPRWNDVAAPTQAHLSLEDLLRFEAATLFVERVRTHKPSFVLTADNAPAVAHICSRLDGIPLALEMAAARVHVFTLEELATRLDGALDRWFQLLTSGSRTAPQRQQTLRATLEWSYGLLTPTEQQLLVRLSVFSGGWTVAAAEAVTGFTLDLLAQLVNKSLVIANQQADQTRYRLLETVRQFAAEQIKGDEMAQREAQRQHSRYYLHLLGAQEERLQGPQQRTSLDTIRTDFENISVAWHWAVDQHEFTLLASAIHALFLYCEVRANFRTGMMLFAQANAELQASMVGFVTAQPALQLLRGQILVRLGACEVMLGDFVQAEQHLQEGLLSVTADQEQAFALIYWGVAADEQGDITLGHTRYQDSLALSQRCNDVAGMASALRHLSMTQSDHTKACRLAAESLALWRKIGRPDRIADVLGNLAWSLFCFGNYLTANAYWRECLTVCAELDLPNEKAWALDCLGFVAWCQGEMPVAEQFLREALAIYTELGRQSAIGMCKAELALVLSSTSQVEQAIVLAREGVAITREVNSQMMLTLSLNYLGAALLAAGDWVAARHTLLEAIQRAWDHQYFYNLMNAFYYFAEMLVLETNDSNLPVALERKALVVTVLSCVRTQAATWQIYRDKAAQLQAEIEGALPAELLASAIARGQSCTLEEMVNVLLEGEPDAGALSRQPS